MIANGDNCHHLTIIHAQWHILSWHISKGLPVIAINGHSTKLQRCRSQRHLLFFVLVGPFFPYSHIYNCYSSYFVFPQDTYDRPCLSNSYDLGQHAFFHSRRPNPPPPPLSFRSSNGIYGKSPYVSNIAGPLCSSSITFCPYLLLRSLVPEVEVTRTVTQSQRDKMHNRRCCRELGSYGEASTKTEVHAIES